MSESKSKRARVAGTGLAVVGILALMAWLLWDAPTQIGGPALGPTKREASPQMALPEGADLPGWDEPEVETALVLPEPVAELSEPVEPPKAVVYYGSVQDAEGAPIEGARLSLHVQDPDQADPPALVSATTNAEGRYRMELPAQPEERLLIRAEAEGYGSLSLSPAAPNYERVLQLSWIARVSGQVRDAASGAPVGGVAVSIAREADLTGPDGAYSLDRVAVGAEVQLRASHDDYATVAVKFLLRDRSSAQVDVELERGVVVDILVRDRETLEPLVGVQIGDSRRGEPFVVTYANGEFPLRVAERGEVSLWARLDGYASLHVVWTVQRPDAAHAPVLSLQPNAWVEGTVRDTAGEPLEGAGLYATSKSSTGFDRWSDDQKQDHGLTGFATDVQQLTGVLTDAEGTFKLPVLPAQKPYVVTAYSESHVSTDSAPVLLRAGGEREWVDIVCGLGATIRGQALYNGEPWSGPVRCMRPDGEFLARGHVLEDGRYELACVAPGNVVLELRDSGDPPQRAQLTVEAGGEHTQDFEWEREVATITGHVVWSSGEPAAGATVYARGEGSGRYDGQTTDDEGLFTLEVDPWTSYSVSARALPGNAKHSVGLHASRHYARQRVKGVAAGSEDIEIVLAVPGSLSLQLVDAATGAPIRVADAHEHQPWLSWRAPGEDRFQSVRLARIDVDGMVRVLLPLGEIELSVHLEDEGWVARSITGLRVLETDTRAPEVVALRAGLDRKIQLRAEPPELGSRPEGCLLFALADHELPLIRGPCQGPGGKVQSQFGQAGPP